MKKDTRTLLIDAAADLLDKGGPAEVTLREVGRLAGVSHNAPYKHFASKEELLSAVVGREFELQSQAISGLNVQRSPLEALRTLTRGYIEWARTHPARFKLAFADWKHESNELAQSAAKARVSFVTLVANAQAKKELPAGNPERIAWLLLALVHGACDLALSGHLSATGKGAADPEHLADDLIKLLSIAAKKRS
jgi:AcrR family transcriptional regulator